ncbi:glycoside hydrolase family 3 protein [Nocardioides mesophilus]|uniref:Glycoside hydrolase family 3 protein n=1 Tax=Nocardioides mesophilus TaxID=433659 RepID=A0A7G9RBP7_9ACTN|nr:glycoside hydrolase family 3 protein [Nocardioides mesophilus]QNN53022.1 glycoside hydrolase family 3 protein [Nocardioides mesophilus]
MTALERLAASVLLPGFSSASAPDWLLDWLDRGLAGVCLFGQNVVDPAQLRRLTDELHARRAGVLVASDEEGGTVTRMESATGSSWPGHGTLGALDDPRTTYDVARGLGAAARAAGIDVVAAPVVDVASEPDNPVIGVRSFGADPALVARHGAQFVEGLQAAGVAACAKHFPGHGATRTDSHVALPVIEVDEATWRRRDLPPFTAAVGAGTRCVMTAHVVLTALDAVPATMSAPVLRLLREELDYDGVIVSDALDMRAISHGVGRAEGAVRALEAGVDLLCIGNPDFPDPYDDEAAVEEVVAAVVAAVAGGRLTRERLEEASGRVAALGAWAAQQAGRPRTPQPADLGVSAARCALQVRGEVGVRDDAVVLVPRTAVGFAAGRRESALVAELTARRPSWPVVADADATRARGVAADGRRVVVVVDGRLDAEAVDTVRAVLDERPDSVVVYGGPAGASDPGDHTVHTHGGGRATARAAADLILEETR